MLLEGVDIAATVVSLLPNANFGGAATYSNLQDTWRDQRRIPTEQELQVEWDATVKEEVRLNDVDDKRQIEYPSQYEMVSALMADQRGDPVPLQQVVSRMDAVDATNPRVSL